MPQGIRDQTVDIEQERVSSVSPLILNDGDDGEQCIFLQVKEEEREVELAPSQREHEISVLVVSETTALDDQMETREIEVHDQLVSGLHSGPFSSSGGFCKSRLYHTIINKYNLPYLFKTEYTLIIDSVLASKRHKKYTDTNCG